MKTIFLIAGESGSGKDTLVNRMCDKYGMKKLISYTTRERREGEGDTHIFIDKADIKQYEDKIIAFTEINGAIYFTTKDQLKDVDFYIIDMYGIQYLKERLYKDEDFRMVSIYVTAPFYNRCSRVIRRGDKKQVFLNRDKSEREQFETLRKNALFDYAIQNVNLDKSAAVFDFIVKTERGGLC